MQVSATELRKGLWTDLEPHGFAPVGEGLCRKINDVEQYVTVEAPGGSRHWLDIELAIVSREFQRKVYGQIFAGAVAPQICRMLSDILGVGSAWTIHGHEEAEEVIQAARGGLLESGVSFLNSIDSTERVVQAYLLPGYQIKAVELSAWEVAFFKGEAGIEDKPAGIKSSEQAPVLEVIRRWQEEEAERR